MAIITRYTNTIQGSLIMTGNTGGLLRTANTLNPGSNGSCPGAWITTDTALATPATWVGVVSIPIGENVTYNWQESSSSAILTLPVGSTVKHAELIWSGLNYSAAGALTVTGYLNNPVTLVNPSGNAFTVTPNTTTKQFWVSGQTYYTIAADVTTIMNGALSGKYTVKGIPAGLSANEQNSTMGWILMVAYYNPLEKLRNLNMYVAMEGLINTSVTFTVSGFVTPNTGTPQAKVIVAGGEGEPGGTGDYMKMGQTVATLVTLSGPNNFANNFFASQINDNNGTLDTSGTFGRLNSIAGSPGTPVYASRYGWDITNIDASNAITLNQTSALFRAGTTGDGIYVSAIGIQIDSLDQPNLTSITKSGPEYADVGQTITYTIVGRNEGSTTANNTIFRDTLPNGVNFVANSVVVNGSTVAGISPVAGFSLGTIAIAGTFTVAFQGVISTTVPTPNPVVNNSFITYSYVPVSGASSVGGSAISNNVLTQVNNGDLNVSKGVDFSFAKPATILTYTVLYKNTGSTSSNNVTFRDTIPSGTTFVSNSLIIDGVTYPGVTPDSTLDLGTISSGASKIIKFQVTVDSPPTSDPVLNSVRADYSYTVDPSVPNGVSRSKLSNQAITDINSLTIFSTIPNRGIASYEYVPNPTTGGVVTDTVPTPEVNVFLNTVKLSSVKYTTPTYVDCGDIITYTILITNSGTTSANNVILTDTIPNQGQFVANSLTVNGVTLPGLNPGWGVNIGTIPVGTSTLTFQVKAVCPS